MKLYKDGKVMQNVDKDQLDICLDAGWSRTRPVEKVVEKVTVVEKQTLPIPSAKKVIKIKSLKKKK